MADVSNFQSLAQLAVALNIGFTAVAAFAGTAVEKEKDRIELLFETAKDVADFLKSEDGRYPSDFYDSLKGILDLRQEANSAEQKFQWYFSDLAKWIGLGAAVVSFVLLCVTSFEITNFFGFEFSEYVGTATVALNAPILFAVGWAAWSTGESVKPLRAKRIGLDNKLQDAYGSVFAE